MHPKGQFCGGNGKCGCWRECSVGGDVFSLRESRSAQQKGQPVRNLNNLVICARELLLNFRFNQIHEEQNVLQDGTLIDLCGATLLWRSAEGLQSSPVIFKRIFFCKNSLYWTLWSFFFLDKARFGDVSWCNQRWSSAVSGRLEHTSDTAQSDARRTN